MQRKYHGIDNLRNVDHTVLLATNIEDIEEVVSSIVEHSIKLNVKKPTWSLTEP